MTIMAGNIILQNDNMQNKTLKHSTLNCPFEPLVYRSYQANEKLCIVNYFQYYLGERNPRVDTSLGNLLITFGKPHRNASVDTISRWVKEELFQTDIDTNTYKTHGCRAASTSKAKQIRVLITEILKQDCLSTGCSFKTFYARDIIDNT